MQIEAEWTSASASAELSFVTESHTLTLTIALERRDDTFRLTLAIDQISARIRP